jgi:hypothetical protein
MEKGGLTSVVETEEEQFSVLVPEPKRCQNILNFLERLVLDHHDGNGELTPVEKPHFVLISVL